MLDVAEATAPTRISGAVAANDVVLWCSASQ